MEHLAYQLGVKLAAEQCGVEMPLKVNRPMMREGGKKEEGDGYSTKRIPKGKEEKHAGEKKTLDQLREENKKKTEDIDWAKLELGEPASAILGTVRKPINFALRSTGVGSPVGFLGSGIGSIPKGKEEKHASVPLAALGGGLVGAGMGALDGGLRGGLLGTGVGVLAGALGTPEEGQEQWDLIKQRALKGLQIGGAGGMALGGIGGGLIGGIGAGSAAAAFQDAMSNSSKFGEEYEHEYVIKAREYADRYHKALLTRFKAEHDAKIKPKEVTSGEKEPSEDSSEYFHMSVPLTALKGTLRGGLIGAGLGAATSIPLGGLIGASFDGPKGILRGATDLAKTVIPASAIASALASGGVSAYMAHKVNKSKIPANDTERLNAPDSFDEKYTKKDKKADLDPSMIGAMPEQMPEQPAQAAPQPQDDMSEVSPEMMQTIQQAPPDIQHALYMAYMLGMHHAMEGSGAQQSDLSGAPEQDVEIPEDDSEEETPMIGEEKPKKKSKTKKKK